MAQPVVTDQPMTKADFRSDTVTWPTLEMRAALANAVVGDDVWADDPTVKKLEELAAATLDKEAALFVPSGTMGNLIALCVHTRPGDEVIIGDLHHSRLYEAGGIAAIAGAMPYILKTTDGRFELEDVRKAIRKVDDHFPRSRLVVIENTANLAGGIPLPASYISDVAAIAKAHKLRLHIDGARLFNAAVSLGVPAKDLVRDADSVMFCLSKGLCAPVGSMLVGTKKFITAARRRRKMLGGGLRQVGILAAAGLIALEKMVDRLAEDHDNAKVLAQGLSQVPGIELQSCHTNIVWFRLKDESKFTTDNLVAAMAKEDLVISNLAGRVRLVTHYWIKRSDVERFLSVISRVMGK